MAAEVTPGHGAVVTGSDRRGGRGAPGRRLGPGALGLLIALAAGPVIPGVAVGGARTGPPGRVTAGPALLPSSVATQPGGAARPGGPGGAALSLAPVRVANQAVIPAAGAYTALTPCRVEDTRLDGRTLSARGSLTLGVVGSMACVGGGQAVVPSSATAVVMNATVTGATGSGGYLTLYPAGSSSTVSNLNFAPGETVPNLTTVGVGVGGAVTVFDGQPSGTVQVVLDLEGYYAPAAGPAGQYVPLAPARIVDTRQGSGYPEAGDTLGAGATLTVQVGGEGGVPAAGVAAVVANLTETGATAGGYLTAWPAGLARPTASNLNFMAGETVPNRIIVPLGTAGQVSIFNALGDVNVIVDVNGYYTDATAAAGEGVLFTPLSPPQRVEDTRTDGRTLAPGGTLSLALGGTHLIPQAATAVAENVTEADATAGSYLTVYPEGAGRPAASDLNFAAGEIVPNFTQATLGGAPGSETIFNAAGSADVIVDVDGYFAPPGVTILTVTTTALPAGTVGTAYPATTLGASGGTPPYTWQVTSGSPPPGLTLAADGALSGTPTAPGTFAFTVAAADASNPNPETATAQLAIAVTGIPSTTVTSDNWSGYIVQGGPYTQVTGTFVVPSLSVWQAGTWVSEWVGIDGATPGDANLIQAGVEEYPDPANPGYFYTQPWWEILPAPETPIAGVPIAAGQLVTVTIWQVSGVDWEIQLTDDTTGQTFSTEQVFSAALASAEWIVEAPMMAGQVVPLAPYTTTTFSNLRFVGTEDALEESLLVQNGVQVSTPSALTALGFAVAYGDVAPPAP